METFNQAIHFGVFILPWSAIMLALGLVVGVVVTHFLAKKCGFHKDFAMDCCIIAIPCGILGSRLFAVLSGKIVFSEFFRLNVLGVNLFGALLFAAIGIFVYAKCKKLSVGEVFDVLTPGLFFGMAVGRWADFFLCEGLGPIVPSGVPKFFPLVTFTAQYFQDGTTVAYSVFFLEFLVCAAIGALALFLLKRKKLEKGDTFLMLVGGYAFLEFFMEWMRPESLRQMIFTNIRFNQLMSLLLLVAIVLYYLIRAYRRPVPNEAEEAEEAEEPSESDEPELKEEASQEKSAEETELEAEEESESLKTESEESDQEQV